MSIKLAKDATATPALYSDGDGSDPVAVAITLDGTSDPTHVTASPATDIFVWADDDTTNIDNYSGISASIVGSDPGIAWELSTDNITFAASINLANMDVSTTHQAVQIYARATAINDGSVLTANYTTADIEINTTSNPAS